MSSLFTLPSQFASPYNVSSLTYGNVSYPTIFSKCLNIIKASILSTFSSRFTSAFSLPCSVNSYTCSTYFCIYSTSALFTTPSQFASPYNVASLTYGNVSYPTIFSKCLNIIKASILSTFSSRFTSAFSLPCSVNSYTCSTYFCIYSTSALFTTPSQFASPYNVAFSTYGNVSYPSKFAKCLCIIKTSVASIFPLIFTSALTHPCSVSSYPCQFAKCFNK